ncbi:hypothetical protein ACYSNW_01945 [Enterococcus sp. LJL99]
MRKIFMSGLILSSIVLLVGCNSNDKKTISSSSISNSSTQNSETKLELTKEEYDSFVGTWECIDSDWTGEKVYISKTDNGLSIQYDGEEKTNTEPSSRSKEGDDMYYSFVNRKEEMSYTIALKPSGNIILNRGTTKKDTVGLSAPMEYKRISE